MQRRAAAHAAARRVTLEERRTQHVGRRIKVAGPGGARFETILSVASGKGGPDDAVVTYRTAKGEIKHARGFDIAFNWSGWVGSRAPRAR